MIFTIPNVISAIRIASIPFFLWLLLGADRPAAAGWTLLAIGGTDWIDGYLARKLDQVSELGKVLDPVADRLAIVAAVIGGWIGGVIPWWIALLLMTREVIVGLMAAYLQWKAHKRIEVRYIGKLATWEVYGGIAAFYVYAGTDASVFAWLAWGNIALGLVLYYVVAVQYAGDVRAIIRQRSAPVSSD